MANKPLLKFRLAGVSGPEFNELALKLLDAGYPRTAECSISSDVGLGYVYYSNDDGLTYEMSTEIAYSEFITNTEYYFYKYSEIMGKLTREIEKNELDSRFNFSIREEVIVRTDYQGLWRLAIYGGFVFDKYFDASASGWPHMAKLKGNEELIGTKGEPDVLWRVANELPFRCVQR